MNAPFQKHKDVFRIRCCYQKGKRRFEKRKAGISAGLFIAVGRVRNRNRKRMEIPVHRGTGRRRRVCAFLRFVFGYSGTSDHDDGICGRTRQPKKSGQGVSGAGKARTKMAYSWVSDVDRLLSADDVLHNRRGLDAALFLSDRRRKAGGD